MKERFFVFECCSGLCKKKDVTSENFIKRVIFVL